MVSRTQLPYTPLMRALRVMPNSMLLACADRAVPTGHPGEKKRSRAFVCSRSLSTPCRQSHVPCPATPAHRTTPREERCCFPSVSRQVCDETRTKRCGCGFALLVSSGGGGDFAKPVRCGRSCLQERRGSSSSRAQDLVVAPSRPRPSGRRRRFAALLVVAPYHMGRWW